MTTHPTPFDPVPIKPRHDGWTPERQAEFIEALAECGCVGDACRRVGMSADSAYKLRRRFGARDFRLAWDAALDYAIRRLSDAAFSRALHGVAVPRYYKGEVVGEHRRFDENLTRFLLRYRDPLRYGKFNDRDDFEGHDEQFATELAKGLNNVRTQATLAAAIARRDADSAAAAAALCVDVSPTSSSLDFSWDDRFGDRECVLHVTATPAVRSLA